MKTRFQLFMYMTKHFSCKKERVSMKAKSKFFSEKVLVTGAYYSLIIFMKYVLLILPVTDNSLIKLNSSIDKKSEI